jgi:hypothetical protein
MQIAPTAQAILTAGDPVKNARAILRNALPIENKPIRKVAKELESINDALRIPGSKSLGPIIRATRSAENTFFKEQKVIIAALASDKKDAGLEAIEKLKTAFKELDAILEAQNKQEVPIAQQKCLRYVGNIEEAMVQGFPFEVCCMTFFLACL